MSLLYNVLRWAWDLLKVYYCYIMDLRLLSSSSTFLLKLSWCSFRVEVVLIACLCLESLQTFVTHRILLRASGSEFSFVVEIITNFALLIVLIATLVINFRYPQL